MNLLLQRSTSWDDISVPLAELSGRVATLATFDYQVEDSEKIIVTAYPNTHVIEDTEFEFSYKSICAAPGEDTEYRNSVDVYAQLAETNDLLEEWTEGSLCTGIFDGSTPTFDQVTLGRYDTDELPIDELKEECEDWCGFYSDQGSCCFYWANDYNDTRTLSGEIG